MISIQLATTLPKRSSSRSRSAVSPREQRDLLGVLPHAHEIEAEVGLEPLLAEIERDQRPADEMRQRGSDHRVEQRRPDQIARDRHGRAEQRERRGGRQRPQDHHERAQRDDRAEQPDAERERAFDEQLDVLGDALVGIVGRVAEQLHAVVVGAAEPVVEILPRHPAPPADLQPLIEIELIDREHDEGRRQRAEEQELADERVPVALLQRIVEAGVPLIDQDGDADDRQLDRDHGAEQDAAGPAVLGEEIGTGEPPDDGERREEA